MAQKKIEISGTAYIYKVCGENGNQIDCFSQYASKKDLNLKVDGKEYNDRDLADAFFDLPWSLQPIIDEFQEGKNRDLKKLCNDNAGSSIVIYEKEVTTTIEIEVPDGEEFNPQKAAIVTAAWIYPDGDIYHMVVGLLYGDKVFPLYPKDCDPKEGVAIWSNSACGIEYTNETASDEQLIDASKLPVLVFRYQTLSYCFGPSDEFDEDEYSELTGPGVVSAINDAGDGRMFICADSLEYINSGELAKTIAEEGVTAYEIALSATEKKYVLLNSADKPDDRKMLETIAAIWEESHENCSYSSVFNKLIFRVISRDPENYAENHDFILDNCKVYDLPEGKLDEIVASLTDEDQELNKEITPFGEYEEE